MKYVVWLREKRYGSIEVEARDMSDARRQVNNMIIRERITRDDLTGRGIIISGITNSESDHEKSSDRPSSGH